MSVRLLASDNREHCLRLDSWSIEATWEEDRWLLSLAHGGGTSADAAISKAGLAMKRGGRAEGMPPENPVFQQCFSRVTADGKGEILLVGQHGLRHFSAVFLLSAEGISLEVADRWTSALPIGPWRLGWSIYGSVTDVEDGAALVRGKDGAAFLVFATGGELSFAGGGQAFDSPRLRREADDLAVVSEPAAPVLEPATFQYGLRVRFLES